MRLNHRLCQGAIVHGSCLGQIDPSESALKSAFSCKSGGHGDWAGGGGVGQEPSPLPAPVEESWGGDGGGTMVLLIRRLTSERACGPCPLWTTASDSVQGEACWAT